MGHEELGEDERFSSHHARGENEDLLDEIIGEWAGRHTAEELDRIVNEAGVVCAPVYTAADIYDDPYFRERDLLVSYEDEVHGTVSAPGVVPKLSGTPGSVRQAGALDRRAPTRTPCWPSWASTTSERARCARRASSERATDDSEERRPPTPWPTAWEWTWEGRSPTCSSSTTTARRQWRVKTPSTPRDPSDGVLTGVERICAEAGIAPGDLRNLVHGTTVATNAVLESKGARVGLVTTAGLRPDPPPRALPDAGARWPAGSS